MRMIYLKNISLWVACSFFLLGLSSCAKTPNTYDGVSFDPPYSAPVSMESIIESQHLRPTNIGYLLHDLTTGAVRSSANANNIFIPASTAKLFTGFAALKILGGDYRFQTKLCANGGDLYLVGGGDPSLKIEDLMDMSIRLADIDHGPYRNFYYDDSRYPKINHVEESQPADAYYNPSVSALSTKDALLLINWQRFENTNKVFLYQSPSLAPASAEVSTDWLLDLDVGDKGQSRFPLKDPAQHTANLFQLFADRNGVILGAGTSKVLNQKCDDPLVIHESLPLKNLVKALFETSSNLQAELIGLAVARKLGKNPKNLKQSADELAKWYRAEFPDEDWAELYLENHSGLSIKTRISPSHMVALLTYGKAELLPLMPISGWKGWLKKRLQTPDVSLRVWAKTGAVNYGIGLAGYLYSKSEKPMAFTIFVNELNKREIYDFLTEEDKTLAGSKASEWNGQAKRTIDEIVRLWVYRN